VNFTTTSGKFWGPAALCTECTVHILLLRHWASACLMMSDRPGRSLSLSNDHSLRWTFVANEIGRGDVPIGRLPGPTQWSATTPRPVHCCAVSPCFLLDLSRRNDHWSAANPINRSIYNFCPRSSTLHQQALWWLHAATAAKTDVIVMFIINSCQHVT